MLMCGRVYTKEEWVIEARMPPLIKTVVMNITRKSVARQMFGFGG
jgi:hypothetical protein